MGLMLARQQDVDDSVEVPPLRLRVVGEPSRPAANDAPVRQRRLPFVGHLIGSLRAAIGEDPERTAWLVDRLILTLVILVLMVSLYVLIVDPS
jgi:hypothetical protein